MFLLSACKNADCVCPEWQGKGINDYIDEIMLAEEFISYEQMTPIACTFP